MMRFFEKLNAPMISVVVLVLFIIVDGFLFYRYQATLSSAVATKPETEAPLATLSEQDPTTAEETTTAALGKETDALRVGVRIVEAPSWLRIQVDGQTVLEQVSEPGFSREFEADQKVSIRTGNAGAVQIEANGQNLGRLGASGEVTSRTFTR